MTQIRRHAAIPAIGSRHQRFSSRRRPGPMLASGVGKMDPGLRRENEE